MKPDYQKGKLSLYHADCMEIMTNYPDGYFDLAIVDPPYGIGRDGQKYSTSKHGGRKKYKFKGWDNLTPSKDYFKLLFKVSKNQIIWGGNYFTKHLPKSMGWIFWDKGQRICNSDGELAFTSFNRALRVFEKNRVFLLKEGTIHPTKKPRALYSWLLENYAKPGNKILDTHLGSGSHAIEAYFSNHCSEFVGIELDEDYFADSVKRIERETAQMQLFHEEQPKEEPEQLSLL